jgi:phosphoribosylformylglycinamidine (FGAM) synthase PurS component
VELDVKSASLADANEAVAKMCDQLLANPLIETCEFEVTE